MSIKKNKAALKHWIEALNARDLNRLDQLADEYYTPDYILHDPNAIDLVPGPEGVKQFMRSVLKSWKRSPEINITIEDTVAEEEKIAIRFTTHNRPDPSTGEPVDLTHFAIFHFSDGKIAEVWEL